MKVMKIFIVYVLLVAFALACVGCGDTSKSPNATTAADSSGTAAASSSNKTTSSEDPFGKYTPSIDMSAVTSIDSWMKLPEGQTLDDNIWTRTYRDELGININILWSTTGDQVGSKTSLMIASNDLPDLFCVNRGQFEQLYAADRLQDLTEAYDKFASPFVREKIYNEINKSTVDATTKDGKLYGLAWNLDYVDSSGALWVRTDWLKQLNLQEPKTIADVENIAKAFMSNGVNNGKPAKYGIAFTKEFANRSLFNSFHAYPPLSVGGTDFFLDDGSGKLVNGKLGSEMKNCLTRLQKWYSEGIIPKDFGVIDEQKSGEDIANGLVGIKFGGLWDSFDWLPAKRDNPDLQIKSIALPSIDDKPARTGVTDLNIQGLWVVRNGYEHPEAAIKILNINQKYLFDSATMDTYKYGWDLNGNNMWCFSFIYNEPMRKNLEIFQKVREAFKTKDTSNLNTEQKITYDQMVKGQQGDPDSWVALLQSGPEGSSFGVAESYLNNDLYQLNAFNGIPTETMIEKNATLQKLFAEMMTKVILGADISEFDNYVKKSQNLGEADIEKEVNDWYQTNKK